MSELILFSEIREKYEYRYVENNIQTNEEQRETQCPDKYNSSDGEVNEEQIDDKQVNGRVTTSINCLNASYYYTTLNKFLPYA